MSRRAPLVLCALFLCFTPPVHAEESGVLRLEKSADYWEAQGRQDKAIEAWELVLRVDPHNVRALAALARLHSDAGHAAKARYYEELLAKFAPQIVASRHAPPLTGPAWDALLAEARHLAAIGKYREAVARYRELFAGRAPNDRLALEYYQALAGISEGRVEAKAGMEQLLFRNPNWLACQLAYAELLTYEERWRRDGIARLEALSGNPGLAIEARRDWRNALLWLGARVADKPLYRRYLLLVPGDAEVAAKLASIRPEDPEASALRGAFSLLNKHDLEEAQIRFQRLLLRNPRDVSALAGLSSVRLAQQRFPEARELAQKAKLYGPNRASLWQKPLAKAEFWCLVSEAIAAQATGEAADQRRAEAMLRTAIAASPEDAPYARLLLADALAKQGQDSAAEKLYRELLDTAKLPLALKTDALRGLWRVLLREGKLEEVAAAERALLAESALTDPERRTLRVELLRARARVLAEHNEYRKAVAVLSEALPLAPDSVPVRVELIEYYLAADDVAGASKVADSLLLASDDTDLVLAAARIDFAAGRWGAAIKRLERLDAQRLTPETLARKANALANAQIELRCHETREFGSALSEEEQNSRFAEIEQVAGEDPELRSVVAVCMAQSGLHERATALALSILSVKASLGARFRAASVLLDGGEVAEERLRRLLVELESDPGLGPRERLSIASLRRTMILKQVDRERVAGEFSRAFQTLEPALIAAPEDRDVLTALARLYLADAEPKKGAAIYQRLLKRFPEDFDLIEATAQALVAAGEKAAARDLAERTVRRTPSSPRAWLLLGRIARATGDDKRAREALHRGLEVAPATTELSGVSNLPLALPPGDKTHPLTTEEKRLLAEARAKFGSSSHSGEERAPGSADSPRKELQNELEQIDGQYAPRLEAHLVLRYRTGDPGLGRLFEATAPLVVSLSPGHTGRLSFHVTPTYLTAGPTDLSQPGTAEQFGENGAFQPPTVPLLVSSDSFGVALALRYDWKGLGLEIGSTPLGFRVVDVVGELGYAGKAGNVSFGLHGFRTPVTDSVLSFAGRIDNRTQRVWGGVRRNGGQLDLGYDGGSWGLAAFGAYAFFEGENVANNLGGQYGLSLSWKIHRTAAEEVTTGIGLFAMNYDKDQSHFTFGQGGYFSPELFLAAGIPITWVHHADRLTTRLEGEIGVDWFRQNASPFYPTDQALENARLAEPTATQTILGGSFAGGDHVGPYGRILGRVDYKVNRTFTFDASCSAFFAIQWTEVICGLGGTNDFLP